MKLATMNMVAVLDHIINPIVKSYFSDIAYEYRQEQLMETRSKVFGMSQRFVSVNEGIENLSQHSKSKKTKGKHLQARNSCFATPQTTMFNNLMESVSQRMDADSVHDADAEVSPNQLSVNQLFNATSNIIRTQEYGRLV